MHSIFFVAFTSALSTPPAPLREPPDPTVNAISIGSSSFTQQSLPLSYISEWPVWMASESGDAVSLLPTAGEEAEEAGWVNPATFEQLWQPQDLPRPAARAAIGAVLKDGVPRYIFPTIETTCTSGQMVWHNRGLNSLPLAKTWLTFGDVPVDDLRLTCYRQPLPEQEAADDDERRQQQGGADQRRGRFGRVEPQPLFSRVRPAPRDGWWRVGADLAIDGGWQCGGYYL